MMFVIYLVVVDFSGFFLVWWTAAPLPDNKSISDNYKEKLYFHLVMESTYAQHAHYLDSDKGMVDAIGYDTSPV